MEEWNREKFQFHKIWNFNENEGHKVMEINKYNSMDGATVCGQKIDSKMFKKSFLLGKNKTRLETLESSGAQETSKEHPRNSRISQGTLNDL